MKQKTDYLIIGGGVIGMALAHRLAQKTSIGGKSITLLEKESDVALHASSRNSGVIHAGFYYTADSLKAKLTVMGGQALREFCKRNNLPINDCVKLVVARDDIEVERLFELEKRGKVNGSNIQIITAEEAAKIDPNARTWKYALFSPLTSTVDPGQVCQALKQEILSQGVQLKLGVRYLKRLDGNRILTTDGEWEAKTIINCAGLYADKIAQEFGYGDDYTIVPFRGRYIEYLGNSSELRVNLYPVPDLRNPFLGVHFTKKVDGTLKIGPTATPGLWREHYGGLRNFNLGEFLQIAWIQLRMFWRNTASFRQLAWQEVRKLRKDYLIRSALGLVHHAVQGSRSWKYGKSGIRAQLVDKRSLRLVQDFIIEGDEKSIHVLNAVSPGFTCSFAFADHLISRHMPWIEQSGAKE
jgi:(S)-2-hydroxyglutarate dehydrogenase